MPVAAWLCGPLKPLIAETLSTDALLKQGLWNPAYVQQLLYEHWGRVRNHAKPLWTLLAFQLWARQHLRRLQPA